VYAYGQDVIDNHYNLPADYLRVINKTTVNVDQKDQCRKDFDTINIYFLSKKNDTYIAIDAG